MLENFRNKSPVKNYVGKGRETIISLAQIITGVEH